MSLLDIEKPLVEIQHQITELESLSQLSEEQTNEINDLKLREKAIAREIYSNPDVWNRTKIARHPKRPKLKDFIRAHVKDFIELKGDRSFKDEQAIIGGFGKLGDHKIMLIGTAKGSSTKENMERNFGMSHPEGYRKAVRLMKLAERFNVPLVTLVDTPGADPGIASEERNQAEAVAQCIMVMSMLQTPVVSVITGEGGSGGAIALAMGNSLLMTSNAFYSVISPEGCAGIIWGDATKSPEAAKALKYNAHDLKRFNIIDDVISEGETAGHLNPSEMLENIKTSVISHINKLIDYSPVELMQMRYEKYRKIGSFIEDK